MLNDDQRLSSLIRAGQACISIVTVEEDDALRVVREAAMETGRAMLVWSAVQGLQEGLIERPGRIPDTGHAAAALVRTMETTEPVVLAMLDLGHHLSDARTLRALRDLLRHFDSIKGTLVIIDHADDLPGVVRSHAVRFELSLPDEEEVGRIAGRVLRGSGRRDRDDKIEVKLSKAELASLVRNLQGLSRRQIERIMHSLVADDRTLDGADMDAALAMKRTLIQSGGVLEFVRAPLTMDEVGGLHVLKKWLDARRGALSPKGEAYGLEPPRGVLLLGVQGAGKSLCAKAIATSWQRPLLRLDAGVLYDRYIGESERRLRDAFKQAEDMAPVVLWIDEIEKAFASAASRSVDGGLSQRMFGSLLTWMQEHKRPVFLVATANDIEALPPELLRKGRFDEIFFVDLPDEAVRKQIFDIHLKKRKRDPKKFDTVLLARESVGLSGAEIEQSVVAAMHESFAQDAEVDTERIVRAITISPPLSVTMAERIAALREWAEGRCVMAG